MAGDVPYFVPKWSEEDWMFEDNDMKYMFTYKYFNGSAMIYGLGNDYIFHIGPGKMANDLRSALRRSDINTLVHTLPKDVIINCDYISIYLYNISFKMSVFSRFRVNNDKYRHEMHKENIGMIEYMVLDEYNRHINKIK